MSSVMFSHEDVRELAVDLTLDRLEQTCLSFSPTTDDAPFRIRVLYLGFQ